MREQAKRLVELSERFQRGAKAHASMDERMLDYQELRRLEAEAPEIVAALLQELEQAEHKLEVSRAATDGALEELEQAEQREKELREEAAEIQALVDAQFEGHDGPVEYAAKVRKLNEAADRLAALAVPEPTELDEAPLGNDGIDCVCGLGRGECVQHRAEPTEPPPPLGWKKDEESLGDWMRRTHGRVEPPPEEKQP